MKHAEATPVRRWVEYYTRAVKFWPLLGVAFLVLAALSFWQILELRESDARQSETVAALSIALQAEQENQKAKGEEPVAPPPEEIVDDPQIVRGEPGIDGEDGQDGADGRDGVDGRDGKPGASGKPGEPGATVTGPPGEDGQDGKDGTDGTDGEDGAPGTPGKDGVDGQPGANGEPPYGWTSYNQQGKVIYECSRVPAEEWDPARPRYECRAPDNPQDPIVVGGGS